MIDMHVEFYNRLLRSKLKKLGFKNACILDSKHKGFVHGVKAGKLSVSKIKSLEKKSIIFLDRYTKESLYKHIKKAQIDIVLDLDDNIKMFTEGIARLAGEKKIGVCFDFYKLLDSYGYNRARIVRNMKTLVRLCLRKKVPTIIASGARTVWDLRGTYELIAFGEFLGMNRKQAKMSIDTYPNRYIKKQVLVE
jgi:RNase P/RNase MRP subunit p30